ncbi:nucleoside triphosphate pyrophosphatase [Endomicrobium proavitum]|uniref:dTTP/UTP pyrophosphatase n=1 Tax=Endomicrobium proavitum TaxID=1408281 RepID=A0A0G3WK54_9BACT|nr:Maf family protein [Endomicrobium proavitum]AKL98262.1 putative septum formation protein [Endomicrobium proavitum]
MRGKKIILASASPRRISLLKEWGLKFEVLPSNIDESTKLSKPSSIVKNLALQKGSDIASKIKGDAIIISADTIVVLNGKITGKPKNKKDCERIVRELNGSKHKVYTGVAIIDRALKKETVFYDCAVVKMKKLPENKLKKLFGKHMDKAGAYAVQDSNDGFVDTIFGDYYTVVGLPYIKLKKELKNFSVIIKSPREVSH